MHWKTLTAGCSAAVVATLFACSSSPSSPGSDRDPPTKGNEEAPSQNQTAAPPQAGQPQCGDGKCDANESCQSCAKDCGACKCSEAPACTSASAPPPSPPPIPGLNVKLEWKSKEELRAELSARVNAAGPEIRILASALAATPIADEPAAITHLRSLL